MPQIELGYDWKGDTVYMKETYGYGVIIVLGAPRLGKTIELKNIYTQIGKHRPLLIFDYQGEHSDSKYGNFNSKHRTGFLPQLKTIENFGFYISDFEEFADWTSMGFSIKSAPVLMRILKDKDVCENSPERLLRILGHLPVSLDDVEDFNEAYPLIDISEPINFQSKQNLFYTMRAVMDTGLIMAEVGSDEHEATTPGKIHIEDWGELIKNTPHINVNLAMFSTGSVSIARASVGKILQKLLPVLSIVKPCIIIEEAAKICPNTGEQSNEIITSQMQLRDYVIRHQRTGVKLAFVTQDPNLLDQDTLGAGMSWIMTIHKPNATTKSVLDTHNLNYERDIISKLRHDVDKGYRDFVYIEVGKGGKYQKFTPFDSATRIPKPLKLHSKYIFNNKIPVTKRLRTAMFRR